MRRSRCATSATASLSCIACCFTILFELVPRRYVSCPPWMASPRFRSRRWPLVVLISLDLLTWCVVYPPQACLIYANNQQSSACDVSSYVHNDGNTTISLALGALLSAEYPNLHCNILSAAVTPNTQRQCIFTYRTSRTCL